MHFGNMIADTAIVAAAGCAGAVLAGGKCATGAVTAAFASLYNGDGGAIVARAAFSATAKVAPLAIGLAIVDGPLPIGDIIGGVLTAGSLVYDLVLAPVGGNVYNDGGDDTHPRPPTGSKPIDQTDWSGDHQDIKRGIGAGPTDNTSIDPEGNVWGENDDGTWTNHGLAGTYTGSGRASGRRGRDRDRRRRR